jgi:hypothetical protein
MALLIGILAAIAVGNAFVARTRESRGRYAALAVGLLVVAAAAIGH